MTRIESQSPVDIETFFYDFCILKNVKKYGLNDQAKIATLMLQSLTWPKGRFMIGRNFKVFPNKF